LKLSLVLAQTKFYKLIRHNVYRATFSLFPLGWIVGKILPLDGGGQVGVAETIIVHIG